MQQILSIDPSAYQCHPIHTDASVWAETNCHTDILVELLHAMGHEPVAALAFTLSADFEGDQWTFFKFRNGDLARLYALSVEELSPWRELAGHVEEQVGRGRPVLLEVDSFYLPDTTGSAYQLDHVKTTIAVNAIDRQGQRLGYFHNRGYFTLDGADFVALFQLDGRVHPRVLAPYVEFLKPIPGGAALQGAALRAASLELLHEEMRRLPRENPFIAFRERFAADLRWLLDARIEDFHTYAFVTWRQFGACFELGARYLDWVGEGTRFADAAASLAAIAQASKELQFQLARAIVRRRSFDFAPLEGLARQWALATAALRSALG